MSWLLLIYLHRLNEKHRFFGRVVLGNGHSTHSRRRASAPSCWLKNMKLEMIMQRLLKKVCLDFNGLLLTPAYVSNNTYKYKYNNTYKSIEFFLKAT